MNKQHINMHIVDTVDDRLWVLTVSKPSIQALYVVPEDCLPELMSQFTSDPEVTELQFVPCDDARAA